MAEMGSGRQSTVKPSFRAVFTEEGLTTDALEAAARLFARWVARGLVATNREALDPALGLASGPGREDSDGAAPARHVGRTGRTGRTNPT